MKTKVVFKGAIMEQKDKWTWTKGTLREHTRLLELIINEMGIKDPEVEKGE